MAEQKAKPKNRNELLNEAISKVSQLLVEEPQALTVVLTFKSGENKYEWQVNTPKARKIRKQARETLRELWQKGNYNFEEIAAKLRLQALDVQGLLDDEFRTKQGLK